MGRLSLLMTFQHIDVMELLVEMGFLLCTHIGRPRLKWLHPQEEEPLFPCGNACPARWKRGDRYLSFGYGNFGYSRELHLSLVAVSPVIGAVILRSRVASLLRTRELHLSFARGVAPPKFGSEKELRLLWD